MRQLALILFAISICVLTSCTSRKKGNFTFSDNMNIYFRNDSGYIDHDTTALILHSLQNINIQNDTMMNSYGVNTIKYFKDNNNQSIIGCISYENTNAYTFFKLSVPENEPISYSLYNYFNGNWNCCSNEYGNLKKRDGFYTFEGCATGSGICIGYLYFFSNPSEISEGAKIVSKFERYSFVCNTSDYLESKVFTIKDTIIINYNYINIDDDLDTLQNDTFRVIGVIQNNTFELLDSSNFKKYNLW